MSRGRPFEPGNTFGHGRPKGSKNKSTSAAQRLLRERHEMLMSKVLAEALRGDTKCLLWCLNELNRGTPRAPKLRLTPIKTIEDIVKALDLVFNAVANHKRTATDGQALCAILREFRDLLLAQNLPRLETLETLVKKLGGSE